MTGREFDKPWRTFQGGVLYLRPEGIMDQTGKVVVSTAEILAGLATSRPPIAATGETHRCPQCGAHVWPSVPSSIAATEPEVSMTLEKYHYFLSCEAECKLARPSATLAPSQTIPAGMWYFTFFCEDFAAVQRVRVEANAPRQFACGVTGIARVGAPTDDTTNKG